MQKNFMNTDYFNYIGYLKNRNYLISCPGINSLLLVDNPSVDEIISDLNWASGQTITRPEFYRLLEHHSVVLPGPNERHRTQVEGRSSEN
jgi:hypothetical protein